MPPLPPPFAVLPVSIDALIHTASVGMNALNWLLRVRREWPKLRIVQLRDVQALKQSRPARREGRLDLVQHPTDDSCGALIVNDGLAPVSILRIDCFLDNGGERIKGSWNMDAFPLEVVPGEEAPLDVACSFDVPEGFVLRDDLRFRLEFVIEGEQRVAHMLSLEAPRRPCAPAFS
jgi:hypothetical protein